MEDSEEFDTLAFEKRLLQLKDTQESIQALSAWCLKQRDYHKKIVSSWLNVLKRVKVEQRLTLFYLANDVIQYSKRKSYDFVESWGLNLQKATPLVRDDKVRPKILRIFKIWEQRSVYDEEFLSDLTGLLSAGAIKKTDDDPLDFQPQQLVNKIKQCTVLEQDTDSRLKDIHDNPLDLSDTDALAADLKDRSLKDDVEKEINEAVQCVEKYTQALQREIVAREALLALLSGANQYYSTQRGEVKVVAYAYKNFGSRVRSLKRRLDEMAPRLPPAAPPSPPAPSDPVPSPGPDEDLLLPDSNHGLTYDIDKTFNTSLSVDGSMYNLGLSSFLGTESAGTLFNDAKQTDNSNKIEVISNRTNEKQDFDINNLFKNLIPSSDSTDSLNSNNPVNSLPGLDLLSDSNPAPPTSFYGSNIESHNDDPDVLFRSATNSPWNSTTPINANWNAPPPLMVPAPPLPPLAPLAPPLVAPLAPLVAPLAPLAPPIPVPGVTYSSPPASPPRTQANFTLPVPTYPQTEPASDVDHRTTLPPPPPPPPLMALSQMEDVDQRLLPPPPVVTSAPLRHVTSSKDVDHRNLISLTQEPNPRPVPRPGPDQLDIILNEFLDYRVPPLQPSDIVESVDMDLSEDEEQHSSSQSERRYTKNNKVLVGGDNGKTNHSEGNANLMRINSMPGTDERYKETNSAPNTAPALPNLGNPFDNMPNFMEAPPKFNEMPPKFNEMPPPNFQHQLPQFNDMPLQFNDKPRFSEPPTFNEPPPKFNPEPPQKFNPEPPQKFNHEPNFNHEPQRFNDLPPKFDDGPPFRQNFDPRQMRDHGDNDYDMDHRSRGMDEFDLDLRSRGMGEYSEYQELSDWPAPRFRPRLPNHQMRPNGPRHFGPRPWMPPRPHRPPFW